MLNVVIILQVRATWFCIIYKELFVGFFGICYGKKKEKKKSKTEWCDAAQHHS